VIDSESAPYAVVHAAPMFRFKQWTADGWAALADALRARGLRVIATGGPAERERRFLDSIWGARPDLVVRRDGQLDWPELTSLVAGATIYIGPDTSVTHLAAATGCPTIALFGPTDPTLWGPWPASGLARPWSKAAAVQGRGNVWLVQQPLPCTPCQLEGCERRIESYSRCLDELSLDRIMGAVDEALTGRRLETSA
jgi:heptosyltransferase-3